MVRRFSIRKGSWLRRLPAFVAGAAWAVSAWGAHGRPNIVLFVVDDMGVMDTSLPFLTDGEGNPRRYPLNERYRTPNMERLAERGIRFSTFYAQSVSSPSRASLMTGQNAARHRTTNWILSEEKNSGRYDPADWNWDGLSSRDMTLPRVLHEAGYRTIHVGKAHYGHNESEGADPLKVGYDVNIAGSSIGEPGSYMGENGYGLFRGARHRAVPGLEKYHGTSTFLSEALTLEAMSELDNALKDDQPFFLYMSHYAVHWPFEQDPRFISHYADPVFTPDAAGFATLVEGMDKSLGDIMDYLERRGVAENTLIVFLGDNGSAAPIGDAKGYTSSAPLRGKKGTEYEGGVRVPFIASWAATDSTSEVQKRWPIVRNGVQRQMGTIMDIYPTLLEVAGVSLSDGHVIDGVSLRDQLVSTEPAARPEMFMMHFPHDHNGSYFTTLREGPWKLIYYYNPARPEHPACELYNLDNDPTEVHNLALSQPDRVESMVNSMARRLEEEGALYPVDADGNELRPGY